MFLKTLEKKGDGIEGKDAVVREGREGRERNGRENGIMEGEVIVGSEKGRGNG